MFAGAVIISSDGWCDRLKWLLSWPVSFLLHFTIPDCNLPRWERWYLLTFLSSTLWIALFSYLMVWMVRHTLVPHTHTHTHTNTYTQPVSPCVFCPGDHNQLHTWNPRRHHGNHVPGSWHQRPRLYGQPHRRPTRSDGCTCEDFLAFSSKTKCKLNIEHEGSYWLERTFFNLRSTNKLSAASQSLVLQRLNCLEKAGVKPIS